MGDHGFISKLDPELIIQEVMYGSIMAVTLMVTAQSGIVVYSSRSALVIAILAMDFVWGIIDMVLFYRGDLMARYRRLQLYTRVREIDDRDEQLDMLSGELDGTIFNLVSEQDKKKILNDFLEGDFIGLRGLESERKSYLFNAVTAFVAAVLPAVPCVLCLAFISSLFDALLIAGTISSVSLFFIGYWMAPRSSKDTRIMTGLMTMVISVIFTLFAAVLGG